MRIALLSCARQVITIACFASIALNGWAGKSVSPKSPAAQPVSVSSRYILAGDANADGLQIIDVNSGKATIISNGNTASYGAAISPDQATVTFKSIDSAGNQSPVIYDIASGKSRILATAPLAGTPVISASGHVAYTVGNLLIVESPSGAKASVDLGHHVNMLTISSDGKSVVVNDPDDKLVLVKVDSGKKKTLTKDDNQYFAPRFSPDNKFILAQTITGSVVSVNAKSGKTRNLGQGDSAGWLDTATIGITRREVLEGIGVTNSSLVAVSASGKNQTVIASAESDAAVAVTRGAYAWCAATDSASSSKDAASSANFTHGFYQKKSSIDGPVSGTVFNVTEDQSADTKDVVDGSTTKQLSNVPFIHQNNDTPDWWDGNWCCSGAASLQAIQYYNILPKHPMTSSWPTPHNSDYGWYIPNTYTWNGVTFNQISYDPDGTIGRGAYGYITQNGWEDTKGHMAEFINYHGPTSSVDWSPTMAKARTEIDGNKPFVILTSITTAGHYKTCIGYVKNQNTLIFNDPYGNKNTGYYPSDDGRNVRYDWPGYNNGYKSLNTVHCYIWCRMGQPSAPSSLSATAVSSSRIDLSWTDNSYVEASYEILRSTTSGGTYSQIASVGANATSYSNTGLSASTTYYYKVRARNPSGVSPNSNQASATTAGSGPTPTTVIVDNSSAGFSASANWSTGTSAADKYGSNYRFRSTEAISDAAQWNINVTATANYAVYAWWSQGSNRSASASYIMPNGTSVPKNQQSGGGSWQLLGTQSISAGTANVRLSCWTTAGFVVVADAVRIVPQ